MGLWRITRAKAEAGLSVVYVNTFTGAEFQRGVADAEQSARTVLEWTVAQADPHDLILFDAQVFYCLPEVHEVGGPTC